MPLKINVFDVTRQPQVWADPAHTIGGQTISRALGFTSSIYLISDPECRTYPLDGCSHLVIGSDGVFAVCSSADINEIAAEIITAAGAAACNRILLDTVKLRFLDEELDFRDDVTLCVIKLPLFT